MKCEICGREYVSIGVHLRHKHKVDPDAYREEFGILRTTPLVDKELSVHLSGKAKQRLQDDDYRAETAEQCRANAAANKGRPAAGMTRAGKAALAKRNTASNATYLQAQAPAVAGVLREKKTLLDVRKALGTGPTAAKKIAVAQNVGYTAQAAKAERAKRAAATIRAKAMARIAKILPLLHTTKSAAEMCRLGGISVKTYKNWLRAGLIPRHPNGRGPRPT